MRKLSLNNILCIQLDPLTNQIRLLIRDGDVVYKTIPINVTKLTLPEIQHGDHQPDN